MLQNDVARLRLRFCVAALVLLGCTRQERSIASLVADFEECSRPMARALERYREQYETGPPFSEAELAEWATDAFEATYPSSSPRAHPVREALLARQQEAVPIVLARLEVLDLGTLEGEAAGGFLTFWLRESLCGGFSWNVSMVEDMSPWNRPRVRAWVELGQHIRDDGALWELPWDERGPWCASRMADVDEAFMPAEVVLRPGARIRAETDEGEIEILAGAGFGRSYTWNGATRFAVLQPRDGSQGIYGPAQYWEEHDGVTCGVLEEGRLHVETVEEAITWLRERTYMPFVHRNDGLVVGWTRVPERSQLSVEVWQIYVGGARPTELPDGDDGSIHVEGELAGG